MSTFPLLLPSSKTVSRGGHLDNRRQQNLPNKKRKMANSTAGSSVAGPTRGSIRSACRNVTHTAWLVMMKMLEYLTVITWITAHVTTRLKSTAHWESRHKSHWDEFSTSSFKTYLEEFRLHVLAGHQVGQLKVQLDANGRGRHLDGTARRGSWQVVEIHLFSMRGNRMKNHTN